MKIIFSNGQIFDRPKRAKDRQILSRMICQELGIQRGRRRKRAA